MFERPQSGERAILVHITCRCFTEQASLTEFVDLARSAGTQVVAQVTGTRQTPEAGFFVGRGKLKEIEGYVQAQQADIVLFNHALTPAQERNLEQALQCRVLDRTGLILDIFAQRARSFEGKLQVELAQLQHLSTRLVRGWTHLERQKGGIGLRGPGETQLETDRRLIAERIKAIHKRLEKVDQQRALSRRARHRAHLPVVSLVGYTNAGKSTLFNRLTTAQVYTADQLFATLDATLRRLELSHHLTIILADTVGFIQQLPYDLIAAFRATLEETRQASLLLHVVDASDLTHRQSRIAQVNRVLTDIQAHHIKQIIVYNKIDCLETPAERVERDAEGQITQVWLSAVTGAGLTQLKEAITEHLSSKIVHQWVKIPASASQLRAHLFTLGTVLNEQTTDGGDNLLEIEITTHHLTQLLATESNLTLIDPLASLSQPS